MEYTYNIYDDIYSLMLSGKKNVEVRLLNEKSEKILVGDFITFNNLSCELKKNRENLDENEKSPEHLKGAERAYLELVELYNWDKIECVKDGVLRSIEDINDELLNIIEEM